MLRRILAVGILLALTIGAAAQETTLPLLHTFETPFQGPLFSLSPDGTLLAAYENQVLLDRDVPLASDLPILLIDVETGSDIGRLEGVQVDLARSVAFSPDGTQLASYHTNGDLIVWDVATQEALQVYDWLPMGGTFLDYMPDGQSLSLVIYNGMIAQHALFDLTTGSITDILSIRPDTSAELRDIAADVLAMGMYSVGAQTIGADGKIYGATGNGDVYRWDTETRLRELIYPASDERPMRFNVRDLVVLDDGTLAFLDIGINALVIFGPDGLRTDYPLTGQRFALSESGIGVSADSRERRLFTIDLNAGSPEARPLPVDLGTDEDGEPIELRGDPVLAFTTEGDLVIGGLFAGEGEGAIYVVDLP